MNDLKTNRNIIKSGDTTAGTTTHNPFEVFSMRTDGITLVSLVITIVVLLILAGIVIAMGVSGIDNVKDNILKSELGQIQTAVYERYNLYLSTKDDSYLVGAPISVDDYPELDIMNKENSLKSSTYYLLTSNDLEKIGLKHSEKSDDFIVNYMTGEVFNITTRETRASKEDKREYLYLPGSNNTGNVDDTNTYNVVDEKSY